MTKMRTLSPSTTSMWQYLAVPMDAGVLGQFIGDENAHPVSLDHLDVAVSGLSLIHF